MAHDIQAAIRIEAASALMGASAARTGLASHSERQASAGGSAVGDDLAALSAGLPVYAGEVDTARADNRLGLPLGAAYLREASGLLRGSLLPVASDIYAEQSGLLTSASAQATGLPLMVVAIVIGLVIGYVFYRAWRWLTGVRTGGSTMDCWSRPWPVLFPWCGWRRVRRRQDRAAARPAAGLRAGGNLRPG